MIHRTLIIARESAILLIFSRGVRLLVAVVRTETRVLLRPVLQHPVLRCRIGLCTLRRAGMPNQAIAHNVDERMTSPDSPYAADVKAELRKRFRTYRDGLSLERYEELSGMMVEEVKLLPEVQEASHVHVYWPMVKDREIDTRPLVRWLEERGQSIVLPRVVNFERTTGRSGRLTHVRYPGETDLRVNRWGIAEPPPGDAVDVSSIDVVIVPALGAGRNGHRIGHGFGYYDEFLAATAALKICLVYDACLIDVAPAEAHDIALDVVITEEAVLRIPPM